MTTLAWAKRSEWSLYGVIENSTEPVTWLCAVLARELRAKKTPTRVNSSSLELGMVSIYLGDSLQSLPDHAYYNDTSGVDCVRVSLARVLPPQAPGVRG